MLVTASERTIRLNVRELAEFRTGIYRPISRRSVNRAIIGQSWHNTFRERTRTLYPNALFELPLKANIRHRSWLLEIEGRVDQAIPIDGGWRFIEIKTIGMPLPVHPSVLVERYPQYVCQAIAYACLAKTLESYQKQVIECSLLFIDIQTGLSQEIPLGIADEGIFYTQLEQVVQYAQENYLRRERIFACELGLPYPNLRPEQDQLLRTLQEVNRQERILTLEAPTGFGKTGIALYWALNELKSSHCNRILYLTGKTTGQWSVQREIERILPTETPIRTQTFQSKEEHAIRSVLHTCDPLGLLCNEGLEERWKQAGIDLTDLFQNSYFSIERAKWMGSQYGLCPYALGRSALSLADIWVSDYNYVFSPSHSSVFENQSDYNPQKSLLIIDEAHNLPQRVADALSQTHSFVDAKQTLEALRLGDIPPLLLAVWEKWVDYLEALEPNKGLEDTAMYHLLALAEHLSEVVEKQLSYSLEIPAEIRLKLWQASDVYSFLSNARFEKLIYSPEKTVLSLTCLDARKLIRASLERFGKVLLMSASLNPIPHFLEECGIRPKHAHLIQAQCPWREKAYSVALDRRLDTRFRLRHQAYALTAKTLMQLKQASPLGPVVAFFPSYAYAQSVQHAIHEKFPNLRVSLQPSFGDLNAQTEFLKNALDHTDVLLLILGSRFSESIDSLGGKISHALVAGPGLPAMSIEEEATRALFIERGAHEAFRAVYKIPAIRKVQQALGRLVRQPGQKAKILLHCQRFGEEDYKRLLDPVYQAEIGISNEEALIEWLNRNPTP